MKRYYNYYNKPKYYKKIVCDDSNINYYENYEDLTEKYFKPYENKNLLDVINKIYEDDELKLNDKLNLINTDEYKFLIQSLITDDYKNLKVNKYENIRLKLFNHLKKSAYHMEDLLRFIYMLEPLFNNSLYFAERYSIYAGTIYIYKIFSHFEKNDLNEKWKLKYIIFILKVLKIFNVPIIKEHDIKKYWGNKYNFEQRKGYILEDLCKSYEDLGTFENMGEGSLFYYKNLLSDDEELIKNNRYPFINDEMLTKYNNIFYTEQNKQHIKDIKGCTISKQLKQKRKKENNIITVF